MSDGHSLSIYLGPSGLKAILYDRELNVVSSGYVERDHALKSDLGLARSGILMRLHQDSYSKKPHSEKVPLEKIKVICIYA